jgi:hypothetical protein
VLADPRLAGEAPLDSRRRQQLRQRVALHGGAAIRVDSQAGLDAVAGDGLGEELRRQVLALLRCRHPADDVPAELVDDDVRVQEHADGGRNQLQLRGGLPPPPIAD